MSTAANKYQEIVSGIPEVKPGKMFGALCMKTPNGKAAAMFYKDEMVFKLEGEALNDALSLDGARLFDPMGGRPMTGWVQVPFDYADQWPALAQAAVDYVKAL